MMMLPLLLLAADPALAGSVDGLPIGAIPRQNLPAHGCAAYLWSESPSHALVAMAVADPASLRLSIGGAIVDLPRTAEEGAGTLGFMETTHYAAAGVSATLDMTIAPQDDLTQGAAVPSATLSLDRPGQDSTVMPVAGLIGCAS